MAKDFKQGALVWAKMKGFPPWPAKVAFPTDGKTPKSKKPQHYVFFFGTQDFAWILDQYIVPHSEEMLANSKTYKKIPSTMQSAILEIEQASRKNAKKFKLLTKDKIKKGPVSPPPPESTPEKPKTPKRKLITEKKNKIEKRSIKVEKKGIEVESKSPKIEKKSAKKRSASEMMTDEFDKDTTIKIKKDDDSDEEDYSLLIANVPPNNGYSNVAVIPPYNDDSKATSSSRSQLLNYPAASSLMSASPVKKFTATHKKIGFLGLGVMGCQLVNNLIRTGHSVTIWNRTASDVYDGFVEAGAKTARFPAEVIQECDITFCCVSDPEASKCVVFGNFGVLAGFDGMCSNKAYVELTTIDPVTSQEIGEAIAGKGGRYLEAPFAGSRQDAMGNSLVIIAAGDRGLFTECDTVFAAWARHAFYMGCNVGNGSKMKLILSMLAGTSFAALGESMALIERCNLPPDFFMEIVGLGPMNFPLLVGKGRAMLTDDPTVSTPVKHQQKDMTLALSLGHSSQQPLPLTVAANEVYKRAKYQCSESDVSVVRKCFEL